MHKKISFRRLASILIPLLVIILIFTVASNIVANYYSLTMNYMFGEGEIMIDRADGTQDWDAEYDCCFTGNADAASAAMRQFNRSVAEEGIVLLKNTRSALPLGKGERRLNVFGWHFENAPYCAPQSGSSSSDGDYVYPAEALKDAGFSLNEDLLTAVREGVPEYLSEPPQVGRWQNDWAIPEYVPTEAEVNDALKWSDIALIWLVRQGTEGADLPQSMNDNAFFGNSRTVGLTPSAREKYGYDPERHSLELTASEQELIRRVGAAGFQKVIIVINSDNPVELGLVEENAEIDAVLLVGGMGTEGFRAFPDILTGTVNPSGRLSDLYASDFTADPTYPNQADLTGGEYLRDGIFVGERVTLSNSVYTNLTPQFIAQNGLRSNGNTMQYVFQNYEEGIYSGYRYYETRALTEGEAWYRESVVYPFGFGLSYTQFDQYISDWRIEKEYIETDIVVRNIGNCPGKTAVQLYYSAPYGEGTANPHKIEKSAIVLGAFAKTGIIQPGREEEITLRIFIEDMASYDDEVFGCYVLDEGIYEISLRTDSHSVAYSESAGAKTAGDQVIRWYNGRMIVFNEGNPRSSEKYANSEEGLVYKAATNAFTRTLEGISPSFTELSRSDWVGTFPQVADDIDKTATPELIEYFKKYDISNMNNEADEMPATGIDNGLQLIDLRGASYDDSIWEAYLDQWDVDEMFEVVSKNGRGINGFTDLGLPLSVNSDGSMGIKYKSVDYTTYGIKLPLSCTAPVLAKTWNTDLAYLFGETCGEEALQYGMNGWYAPALNLHRSPFAGRYYDYFSEDPFLTGVLATQICSGAGSRGLNVYLKHFALNESEYLRNYSSVWASEQAMRELYLKPFEMCIKYSRKKVMYYDRSGVLQEKNISAVQGIMSSFNRIGNTWAGGNAELLKTVLREEWGFDGIVITDNMRQEWPDMDPDLMIRAGGNVCMSRGREFSDTQSASAVLALREAVHGICYAVVNSNAMNGILPGSFISYALAPWQIALIVGDIFVGVVLAGAIVFLIYRQTDERKHPERYGKEKGYYSL